MGAAGTGMDGARGRPRVRRCSRALGLVVTSLVVASGARAADLTGRPDDAIAPASGRLELRLGLGRRQDTLAVRDVHAQAEGGALSDLAVAGAWFGGWAHVGVAGRLA